MKVGTGVKVGIKVGFGGTGVKDGVVVGGSGVGTKVSVADGTDVGVYHFDTTRLIIPRRQVINTATTATIIRPKQPSANHGKAGNFPPVPAFTAAGAPYVSGISMMMMVVLSCPPRSFAKSINEKFNLDSITS